MGVILDAIKKHFNTDDGFTSWDLHKVTGINHKVVQMNLKRLQNNETLYCYISRGLYFLRTDEGILKARKEVNALIDKYELQNKKYKI